MILMRSAFAEITKHQLFMFAIHVCVLYFCSEISFWVEWNFFSFGLREFVCVCVFLCVRVRVYVCVCLL